MAGQFPFDCPHCGAKRVAMAITGFSAESSTRFALMGECPLCHKAMVAFGSSGTNVNIEFIRSSSWSDLKQWINFTGSAPQPPMPRQIGALPAGVSTAFNEAEANFADRRYASAATGFRRALERGLRASHPEITGSLHAKIAELEKTNAVPKSLVALMNGVRFLGNDGAHDDDDPPADEVEAGRDFTALLLTYLFELPARVREAADRRAKRKDA